MSRPNIAYFEYHDVFEDFYPKYGVTQQAFAETWTGSFTYGLLRLVQSEFGDVVWYAFSLAPELTTSRHREAGCLIRMMPSSIVHRAMWRAFYLPRAAWRWRRLYDWYATPASYLATLSWPFVRAVLRERPDVILVQDYANGRFDLLVLLARCCRIPLIAFHSGSSPERYLGRWVKRWTIPRADWLLASSRVERDRLIASYGVDAHKVRVVLTPIDTVAFAPCPRSEACAAAGLAPGRRYVLFMGRLDDRVKRVSSLIRAFAAVADRFSDVDLVIAGDGPDREHLRHVVEMTAAPARVRFAGWIGAAKDRMHCYNAADCLVLPSRSEGFPTVVGEALACGTPVLASDVGGVSEIVVPGRSGWLVPALDDAALANALVCALSDPDLASMRVKARRVAEERVSYAAVIGQLQQCFAGR